MADAAGIRLNPSVETVEVIAYDDRWPTLFQEEAVALRSVLGSAVLRVEHIGSTSVPGLVAKPTIDILLVPGAPQDVLARMDGLQGLGYEYRPPAHVTSTAHLFLQKVVAGRRTRHLHVVDARTASGREEIEDYLAFRDFLRARADVADEYRAAKLGLAARYALDRARYVTGKEAVVQPLVERARRWRASGAAEPPTG